MLTSFSRTWLAIASLLLLVIATVVGCNTLDNKALINLDQAAPLVLAFESACEQISAIVKSAATEGRAFTDTEITTLTNLENMAIDNYNKIKALIKSGSLDPSILIRLAERLLTVIP